MDKAILVCKSCLNPVEGDASDTPVQVSLAALELLSSIASLPPDTCSELRGRKEGVIEEGSGEKFDRGFN